jgi:hypothetical protein
VADILTVRLPFREQIDFFRRKLNLPTERWDDIWTAAHDRAFIVAGAQSADLLDDLRRAVDGAIANGDTLATFRKNFKAIVAKHGWTGWTGEGTQAGEAWRTRVVYNTNIASSYAAGRWQQLNDPDLLKVRPYWRYIHNDSVAHPRKQHKEWGDAGLTLHHNDAFWLTHYPPNGWGCRCRVKAVRAPAEGDAIEPPAGWNQRDTKGRLPGIDRGWDYAPGANAQAELRDLVDQKLLNLEAPIGAAMASALRPVIQAEIGRAVAAMVDRVETTMQAHSETLLVHTLAEKTLADLAARNVAPQSAGVWLRDQELLHGLRDAKAGLGTALPVSVWRDLPALLAGAKPYLDTVDHALVYAIDLGAELGKVVVRVDYSDKVRIEGERQRIRANFIRTGGRVDRGNIEGDRRYVPLGA